MGKYFSYFNLLLFVVVAIEALILFALIDNSTTKIRGGDSSFYVQTAENLAENGTYSCSEPYCYSLRVEPTMLKPPGYSLFLAGIYKIFGESVVMPLVFHFFLIFLTAIGVKQLARCYIGETESKIASLITATYLPLISLSFFHLSEVLACCVTIWSVFLVKKWTNSVSYNSLKSPVIYSILTGVVFGYAVLVRPNLALYILIILLVPFLLVKNKKAFITSAFTFVISFSLILLPWLIRNYEVSGKFTLGSASGMSLYQSTLQYSGKISPALTIADWDYFLAEATALTRSIKESNSDKTAIEREFLEDNVYKQRAANEISNISLVNDVFRRLPVRIVYFWSVADLSLELSGFHRLAQIQYAFLFILFLIGFAVRRKDFFRDWLIWTPAVYMTLIHLIFHVEPRYCLLSRMPLSIYCAVGVIFLWRKAMEKYKTSVTT